MRYSGRLWSLASLVMVIAVIGVSLSLLGEDVQPDSKEFDYKPRYDLVEGMYRGRAVLDLPERFVARGAFFKVNIRFYNTASTACEFFNPLFHQNLHGLPVALAIYDAEKKYLGDLLISDFGGGHIDWEKDWLNLPSGAIVGVSRRLSGGYVPRTRFIGGRELSAGRYFLQVIYKDFYISSAPSTKKFSVASRDDLADRDSCTASATEMSENDIRDTALCQERNVATSEMTLAVDQTRPKGARRDAQWPFKGKELFRSNVVTLELYDGQSELR